MLVLFILDNRMLVWDGVEKTGNADGPQVSATENDLHYQVAGAEAQDRYGVIVQEISSVITWLVPLLTWSRIKHAHHDRILVNEVPSDDHIGPQKPTAEALRHTSLQARPQVLGPLSL
jgi:hypothetical protein